MKHFRLTDETKTLECGTKLFKIEATVDFRHAKKGDRGGWVEDEENISGEAWVAENAMVFGDAKVTDNAMVSGNAMVFGDAKVFENARVSSYAEVSDKAKISGKAIVSCMAEIYGYSLVTGDAYISGKARISGDAFVSGDAFISGDAYVMWFSRVGSENGTLTAFLNREEKIIITRGCFIGTIEEFREKIKQSKESIRKEYEVLTDFISLRFKNILV